MDEILSFLIQNGLFKRANLLVMLDSVVFFIHHCTHVDLVASMALLLAKVDCFSPAFGAEDLEASEQCFLMVLSQIRELLVLDGKSPVDHDILDHAKAQLAVKEALQTGLLTCDHDLHWDLVFSRVLLVLQSQNEENRLFVASLIGKVFVHACSKAANTDIEALWLDQVLPTLARDVGDQEPPGLVKEIAGDCLRNVLFLLKKQDRFSGSCWMQTWSKLPVDLYAQVEELVKVG